MCLPMTKGSTCASSPTVRGQPVHRLSLRCLVSDLNNNNNNNNRDNNSLFQHKKYIKIKPLKII